MHGRTLTAILLGIGWFRPATRCRPIGTLAGSAWLVFLGARTIGTGANAAAALVVCAVFLLLGAAAAISWHKRRLRGLTKACLADDAPPPTPLHSPD